MKLLGDKIIVRITKENRESIFSKEITRNDGTKTKLFINVAAQSEVDERYNSLFVQTGVVEMVGEKVSGVIPGDIALLDYQLCNSERNLFNKDENGEQYWLNATTTFHKKTEIAYQNRRSRRDQIVHKVGDIDEMSMLLGVVREDKVIARRPYVFLENLPVKLIKETKMGIQYTETQKILTRRVLGVDSETTKRFSIKEGDNILVDDSDIFLVKYGSNKVDCVNEEDCIGVKHDVAVLRAV